LKATAIGGVNGTPPAPQNAVASGRWYQWFTPLAPLSGANGVHKSF